MDSDTDERDFATSERKEEEEIVTPEAADTPVPMEREDFEVQEDTKPEATPEEASEENIPEQPADDSTTQTSETIEPKAEMDATTTTTPPELSEDEGAEANNDDIQMEPAPSQEEEELSPGITVSKETEDVATEDQEEEKESSAEHIEQELDSPQIENEVDADSEPINTDTYRPFYVVSGYTNSLASILVEIPNGEIDYMGGLNFFPGAFIIAPFVLWFLRIVSVKLRNLYISRKEPKKGTGLTTPEALKMEIQNHHTNRHSMGNSSSIETNTHDGISDQTHSSPKIETPITKSTGGSSGSRKEAQSTPTPRGMRMLAKLSPFNNDSIKETRKPRRTESSSKSPRKKRKVEPPKTKTPKTKGSSKKEAQNTPRSRGNRMLANLAPFNNSGIKESESRTSKRGRDKKETQASQGRSLRKRLK